MDMYSSLDKNREEESDLLSVSPLAPLHWGTYTGLCLRMDYSPGNNV